MHVREVTISFPLRLRLRRVPTRASPNPSHTVVILIFLLRPNLLSGLARRHSGSPGPGHSSLDLQLQAEYMRIFSPPHD